MNKSALRVRHVAVLMLVMCWMLISWPTSALAVGDPGQGPGGPVLVLTSGSSTFGRYYAEILRTEGLNAFAVADIATATPATLAAYDVVLLAKTALTPGQVTMLTDWVHNGGNLIAMAPDAQLASLLGITPTGQSISDGYVLINTASAPGKGIVNQTIQFHGSADQYMLNGATQLAALYRTATTSVGSPAATLMSAGLGKAAAFSYDLATSVVYTRQGNPLWAAQERDGTPPIRSNDKFYGNAATDPQPDWVDRTKIAIPQADEQQRWLINLILYMNAGKKPLPRFWYFPQGKSAVVVMTGDDHGNGGTAGRFSQYQSLSAQGCVVDDWACVRSTSYIYTSTPMSDADAAQWMSNGFEIGLHINTNCLDFTPASLADTYTSQVTAFLSKYVSVGTLYTERHHCVVWSDWSTAAEVELSRGIRLDTTYYDWPPNWVNDTSGVFTGSAMPMRFAGLDGHLIDVYMAATQMTDESGQTYPFTSDTLLGRAVGAEGYYGVYTVNAHTDNATSPVSDAVVSSALSRGVPIVSARQMLTWLDARNASSFSGLTFDTRNLGFTVNKDASARNLQAMVPWRSGTLVTARITRNGTPLALAMRTIKGVDYAFFPGDAGAYVATYGVGVSAMDPVSNATGVGTSASIKVTFSDAVMASSVNASTIELRNSANALVATTVSYDAVSHTATVVPAAPMAGSSAYTVTVRGGDTDPRVKDSTGVALLSSMSWSFQTAAAAPTCPCTAWPASTVPATPSFADPNAVELGVKFKTTVNGYIKAIRFYKGTTNTGTHIANLWSSNGSLLASTTFTAESASGWQQANFPNAVQVTAGTVYVASYFAPNGNYAVSGGYFASAGVDNGPISLLSNVDGGGNGVYRYGTSSGFPSGSYNATNYWVDVVFDTVGTVDTQPPSVVSVTPAADATGVSTSTVVTATFSEPMMASSISASTFQLLNPSNSAVPATVSYNAATQQATLTPSTALLPSATYSATIKGGTTDPRVKDLAGNAMITVANWRFTTAALSGGCAAPANPIVAENCLPGSPSTEWDIAGVGDTTIQGFATDISVNQGSTISFKINTPASNYRIDIYRIGYYGGLGARRVATVTPSAALPQVQPACISDATTGLFDCGNWRVSASWNVPASAASGVYIARLVRADTGGASHIIFIVRNDASTSALLYQASDTTWQAYNNYGGNSLYVGSPAGRAYKVSYNRPFATRSVDGGQDWFFHAEYPMVRWLEANGYDVSYSTGIDADRAGNRMLQHKVYMSVGHDEYWSGTQRANVTAARGAGVNLAFFSGNEIFWKTRWEPSIDGSSTPYRTLVCYKETQANAKIDPTPIWTGTWRDPRFSPPADGGRPENELSGTLFMVNDGATTSIVVPSADGKMRFWRNTPVSQQAASASATLPSGTLGYEWDVDADNDARPAGLIRLSTTTVSNAPVLLDQGSTYGSGTATHSATFYKHASGAKVFGAGTVQWSWGLDATHDGAAASVDSSMRQATVNLLADMGVQPGSLQPGLSQATPSTDATAPVSRIVAPTATTPLTVGTAVVISGTASDVGGVVGGVEVSVDGGAHWRRAEGRSTWTFNWTPTATGSFTLRSRATDDSGNIETPSAGITVSVAAQSCPCTAFPSSSVPTTPSVADAQAVNLGVKFSTHQNGRITGLRFYKGPGNTGTHVGAVWSSAGQILASATFTGETASGWQQVKFSTPVQVTANTVYVASYLAPNGNYAGDNDYFALAGVDAGVLHLLKDGESGGNGVYVYGSSLAFPASTWRSSNYWVDVVFEP